MLRQRVQYQACMAAFIRLMAVRSSLRKLYSQMSARNISVASAATDTCANVLPLQFEPAAIPATKYIHAESRLHAMSATVAQMYKGRLCMQGI
jgi:hypothetical protein